MRMWRSHAHGSWNVAGVLSAGAFVAVLNLTLLSPLLTAIASTFRVSEAAAGQLATVSSVVATLVAFGGSFVVDRFDTRTWLRFQASVLLIATFVCALAPSFAWLIAGRLLAGIGGAMILANCLAAAGELFPDPAHRDRVVGVIVSASTIAVIAGLPIVAQLSAHLGWRWAIASMAMPLTVLLAGTRWLPQHQRSGAPSIQPGFAATLRHRQTFGMLALLLLFGLVYVGWLTYYGAYVERDFGQGANALSALFLVAGLAELLGNTIAPWLIQHIATRSLILALTGVFAVPLLLTNASFFDRLWGQFLAASLISSSSAMLYIACNAGLLDTRPEARGRVMALASAFGGGGAALGALLGGLMLEALGSYAAMYRLLGSLLSLSVLFLALANPRRVPNATAADARHTHQGPPTGSHESIFQ